jgi:hypothetical protein
MPKAMRENGRAAVDTFDAWAPLTVARGSSVREVLRNVILLEPCL